MTEDKNATGQVDAVVSQDNTSDIIDASYYCANCKGQGKIIIRPPGGRVLGILFAEKTRGE